MISTALMMWVGTQRKPCILYSKVRPLENIENFTIRINPLTSCASQPSYGKIYTIFSGNAVFLVALLKFEIGSIVCATAPSSKIFILGRNFAGLGSAGIQAGIS